MMKPNCLFWMMILCVILTLATATPLGSCGACKEEEDVEDPRKYSTPALVLHSKDPRKNARHGLTTLNERGAIIVLHSKHGNSDHTPCDGRTGYAFLPITSQKKSQATSACVTGSSQEGSENRPIPRSLRSRSESPYPQDMLGVIIRKIRHLTRMIPENIKIPRPVYPPIVL